MRENPCENADRNRRKDMSAIAAMSVRQLEEYPLIGGSILGTGGRFSCAMTNEADRGAHSYSGKMERSNCHDRS